MSPQLQDALHSWSPPVGVNVAILLSLYFYIVGWLRMRRGTASPLPAFRLAAYVCGVFALWLAIGSPLEALDDSSLLAHMIQHLLLMIAAPALILLGAPALPLLHGLPGWFVRAPLGALLRNRPVQKLGEFLTEPLVCWISAVLAMIAWHVPAAFELALRSDGWHDAEHACFFFTSILFWWPVIQPWPSVARWPRWTMPLYLLAGMVAGSTVSAYLTFSDAVLYPSYANAPRIFTMSPLDDQVIAGAVMWVAMTIAFLLPAVVIMIRYLSPAPSHTIGRRNIRPQAN
jgi:putative membrane protein